LRNPESFDPLKIGRFTVIRVFFEYPGQRGEEKLFIALRHAREKNGIVCHCIKATSRTLRYETDAKLLAGVILYQPKELSFFYEKTVIDPASVQEIPHLHMQNEAARGRYRIEGVMPEDFRDKLTKAIGQSFVLEPKKKKHLLDCIALTT
jgi:hypothetical protein